jgi:hypothetical protein
MVFRHQCSGTVPRGKHESAMCYSHLIKSITSLLHSTTSTMPSKRKRGRGDPLIDGDVELASCVTPETITITKKDGSTYEKQIWISMDNPIEANSSQRIKANDNRQRKKANENPPEIPVMDYQQDYDPVDMSSPPPNRTNTYLVCF